MKIYEFTVNGPLYGYRKSTIPVKTRKLVMRYGQPQEQVVRINAKEYTDFKNSVLGLAMEKGFRRRSTSQIEPAWLSVVPVWPCGARIDWKNVYGGIEDALFENDRYVIPGKHSDLRWAVGGTWEGAMVRVEER